MSYSFSKPISIDTKRAAMNPPAPMAKTIGSVRGKKNFATNPKIHATRTPAIHTIIGFGTASLYFLHRGPEKVRYVGCLDQLEQCVVIKGSVLNHFGKLGHPHHQVIEEQS